MGVYSAATLCERLKRSFERRGFIGMMRHVGGAVTRTFRLWLWDVRHGVETRKRVYLADLGVETSRLAGAVQYEPSEHGIAGILQRLELDCSKFVFIDVGSGKGRVLLLASEFAFQKIVGIEFSARLAVTARKNISLYRSRTQKCRFIELPFGDALEYVFPPEPVVLYLYHPFSRKVLRKFLANLMNSFAARPREIHLIYRRPIYSEPGELYLDDEVTAMANVETVECGSDYSVYSLSTGARTALQH